jgi:tetratricopeptide (TPR) repeat protein
MRLFSLILSGLFLCVGHVFAQNPPKGPPPSPLQQAASKVLREMPVKLYEGRASDSDVRDCTKLIELAPDDNTRRPFVIFLAQYQRIMLAKPERALSTIAPGFLGKDKAKAWMKANDEAVKAARAQWLKDDAVAKKAKKASPKIPSDYQIDLPALHEWTIDGTTALFAVEAAHCLATLDKPQRAMEIIDAVGQQFTDETRVLAAECGADLFIRMQMYQKATEFYRFSLDVLETLKKREYDENSHERFFFSEEQQILQNRLSEKLSIAQRLYEIEMFGPDWIAYRDAQRLHFEGRFLEAYFAYLEIVEAFPDSIYGEAATCYLIEILCKLADKDNIKNAAETFKQKRQELDTAKLVVKVGERFRDPEELMEPRRNNVARLEKAISLWKSIPLGETALTAAEKYTEEFIERDKFGLYRGEAMLDVGLCWLETFLEPEKAEPWLLRANDWFDEVKKLDVALNKLEVPDKSKTVSQAPREERFTDEWTNVRMSQPGPGHLFNRRECKWYLSSKHKEAVLWLGLIYFARGDMSNAKAQWGQIAEIDKEYNKLIADTRGTGTTSTRLLYFLETKPGELHATKNELKAFKDEHRRFAVLFADCAYVAENQSLAEKIYRKLDEGALGQLSKNEKAYVSFAIFDCLCWDTNRNENDFLESRWTVLEGSPSEKRALMGYANRIDKASVTFSNMGKRMNTRELIITKYPNSPEAEEASLRNIFEMTIIMQGFEKIEKYLATNGPDELLEKTRAEHKAVQAKIFSIVDKIISSCDQFEKKYKSGKLCDAVIKLRESAAMKKKEFATMQFYSLP